MKRWMSCMMALGLAVGIAGCKEEPPNLPATRPEPPPENLPIRPTTQQLMEGPRRPLALVVVPLTLDVPESWTVVRLASTSLLQGPAPVGDVTILLATRPARTAEQLEQFRQGLLREQKQDPGKVTVLDRSMLGVTILERQAAGSPGAPPPGATRPLSPRFDWTIDVFAPQAGGNYATYELSFVGLTKDEYQANKDFLRKIIDSVRYTPEEGVKREP